MPCNYDDYPANWKTEIRPRILLRARHHCEQCGVRDGSHIRRMIDNPAVYRYWSESDNVFLDSDRRLSAFYDQQNWHPAVKVVLTVAHIDQALTNNSDANLAAWCQRCHLMFDQRARNLVVKALAMVETARIEAAGLDDERPEGLNVVGSIIEKRKRGRPRARTRGDPQGKGNL